MSDIIASLRSYRIPRFDPMQWAAHKLLTGLELLDETPPERIIVAAQEEVVDLALRARDAVRSVAPGQAAERWHRAALDLLPATPTSFPDTQLAELVGQIRTQGPADPSSGLLIAEVERFLGKYRSLQARASYLMRPNTLEEVQKLDPKKDCNQIVHFISYDFRAELKVLSANYELRPAALPYTAMLFESTGEFTQRTLKRFEDTFLLFANMVEWGLDSRRGRICRDVINRIHGRMAIPNDGYKFVLGNFMFLPVIWNERFGWRKFTDVERLGWFHQFVEVGRALEVKDIPEDFDEMRGWWDDFNRRFCKYSPACRRVFDGAVANLLAVVPRPVRASLREMIVAGLDDTFRACLRYDPPSPAQVEKMQRLFRRLGTTLDRWPRRPWARTVMNYKTYPNGHRVEDLGVRHRAARLPTLPAPVRPAATPEGLPPIMNGAEVPGKERLPMLDWEEIAAHNREDDAWLVFEGHVYDVTSLLVEHPGGKAILLKHLGKDATAAFRRAKHSPGTQIITANYRIGRAPAASPSRTSVEMAGVAAEVDHPRA